MLRITNQKVIGALRVYITTPMQGNHAPRAIYDSPPRLPSTSWPYPINTVFLPPKVGFYPIVQTVPFYVNYSQLFGHHEVRRGKDKTHTQKGRFVKLSSQVKSGRNNEKYHQYVLRRLTT